MKKLNPRFSITQNYFFSMLLVVLLPLLIFSVSIYLVSGQNVNILYSLLIGGAFTMILIVALAWMVNRRYLNTLNQLKTSLQGIQEEKMKALMPLPEIESPDEIGELTRAYNRFIAILKKDQERETALRTSEERYDLVIRGANDGIWDWDLRENQCYYSSRWRYMLGYTEESVRNTVTEWFTRVHPDDLDQLKADINSHLEMQTPHFQNEHRIRHADGTYVWVLARGLALFTDDKKPYRFAGSFSNISKRKNYEVRLLHDAMHDPLTGIPNRIFFRQQLDNALSRANRREEYHAAVLYLDLDRFKSVNDHMGYRCGDYVLVETTQRLKRCLRSMDSIARFGGDEFAILLEEINSLQDALLVARRIHHELAENYYYEGKQININASIGIVMLTRGYQDADEILRDADTAMYQAKSKGTGQLEIFDKEMHAYTIKKMQIEIDLRRAVKNKEFRVFYQPILETKSGEIHYVEALLRWQHPEKGLISCDSFISLAEEFDIIQTINNFVLQTACHDARSWQDAGFKDICVSVNISSRLLLSPEMGDNVRTALADSAVPNASLQLEITESPALYNSGIAIQNLYELSAIGVQICMDDYGIVPSSLEQLKRLPVDKLKISQSFVKDLPHNQDDTAISDAIISMAHILGMKVIASGIENIEQRSYLTKKECDYVQGFYFARPMENADLLIMLIEAGAQIQQQDS